MFTEAGFNALIRVFFIMVVAEGLNSLTKWLWDFEVAQFVYVFFLITYVTNFEKAKEDLETIRKLLRPFV